MNTLDRNIKIFCKTYNMPAGLVITATKRIIET